MVDADGVVIATLRGDVAGAHTLDSALYKAKQTGRNKVMIETLSPEQIKEILDMKVRPAVAPAVVLASLTYWVPAAPRH